MSNALFGHIGKRQWASVRMMFARQDAARRPQPTIAHASPEDAGEDRREFVERLFEKRRKRMDRVDNMPADLRALVHEYGLTVVDAFVGHGVTKPRIIRHLVNTVLAGSVNGSVTPQVHIFQDHQSGRRSA